MSSTTRNYVRPNAPMFRAAGYDTDGNCVSSTGPYATRGPAMASRSRCKRNRKVVRVVVEVCHPVWEVVEGTVVVP